MRIGMILCRLGAIGLILTTGVCFEEPLSSSLRSNHTAWDWTSFFILYGFPTACGLFLIFIRSGQVQKGERKLFFVSHGLSLIAIIWLILWCFVWLVEMTGEGDKAEMLIKHTAYLHLFGVGFSMAGYARGWMVSQWGERSTRFIMTVGWAISYMAWFDLYMDPLKWLWAPAIGGLLVVLGAFLIERDLKRVVEAVRPLT